MDRKTPGFKVPSIPVIINKGKPLTLLKCSAPKTEYLMPRIKLGSVTKEQVIFKSEPGDFLRGEFPSLTLVSRLKVFNRTSSTVARYISNGHAIEKNSNEVTKVIGQNNYDTVFSALCSVISQELRIRALLALLTIEGKIKTDASVQTEKSYVDSACQTDETSGPFAEKYPKQRRRNKRQQIRPYIVKVEEETKIKKVIIDPKSLLLPQNNENISNSDKDPAKNNIGITKEFKFTGLDVQKNLNQLEKDNNIPIEVKNSESELLPELRCYINEDSNFSDISGVSLNSQLSVNIPQLLENPYWVVDNIDRHTETLNTVPLTLLDGSVIMVRAKPMDKFHWATVDTLKCLSRPDQMKLMSQQAIIHWKYCLERDEDGYLPIHQAVLSNDMEFLRPQCDALKHKVGSVDIAADGNITPLQMSIYKGGERCTGLLLQSGADPCLQDDEGKSFFHTAAEVSPEHLKIALDHCRTHARSILMEDEALWNPVMDSQSDEQLAKILLDHVCIMHDNQGYTPLMLASKQGNHATVKLLLEASPDTVNCPTPNCGNTALYLAVAAACMEASHSKNQSKVTENFLKTIALLMESGGDPSLENHSNSSVNVLLTEFNIVDLSVLIANKLTSVKYFDGNTFAPNNINSLMLYKNSNGKVDVTEIRHKKVHVDFKDDANIASTSKSCTDNLKSNLKNSGVNVNGGKKIDPNKDKKSNIEIKEIKTIKIDNMATVSDKIIKIDDKGKTNSVNVNASHFIIVPKTAQIKTQNQQISKVSPTVPQYVKILPKLGSNIGKDRFNVDFIKFDHRKRPRKQNMSDAEQRTGKRPRKD